MRFSISIRNCCSFSLLSSVILSPEAEHWQHLPSGSVLLLAEPLPPLAVPIPKRPGSPKNDVLLSGKVSSVVFLASVTLDDMVSIKGQINTWKIWVLLTLVEPNRTSEEMLTFGARVVFINVILIVSLPTANDNIVRHDTVRVDGRIPFDDQFWAGIGVGSQIFWPVGICQTTIVDEIESQWIDFYFVPVELRHKWMNWNLKKK